MVNGEIRDYQITLLREDGALIDCLVNARVLKARDGRVIAYQGNLRDVTEALRIKSALVREKARAELYLDLLGHDIGNLHQGIGSAIMLAMEKAGDPSMVGYTLGMASDLLKRSSDLVRNVKVISRIRQEGPTLSEMDLVGIGRESLEEIRRVFPGRTLDLEFRAHVEELFMPFEPLGREIFFNLLHNAVKFQERDVPYVLLELEASSGKAIIRVSDKGPGIPGGIKKSLFYPPGKYGRSSSGLGLSIVKELVDRYGGSVSVRDRVTGSYEEGAVFEVILPLH